GRDLLGHRFLAQLALASKLISHRQYRATITAVTALRSFIVSLISSPPPPFRRGHFAQISYMRQRIDFTQISDEAMRGIDTGRGAPYAGRRRCAEVDGALNPRGTDDDETVLHRLAPFLIAGLKGGFPISSSVTAKTPHGFAYGRSRKCS